MAEIKFGCTLCGECCHGHSLPLTLDETVRWLEDGGKVGLFCEAHLEKNDDSPLGEHRRRRSFAVSCGLAQAHVTVIFVAVISGPCPNLRADLKCGIYERRPLVCRIYPAEISPFIQLNIADKACPPDAWLPTAPALISNGSVVDPHLRALIAQSQQTDRTDVPRKLLVCSELNLNVAALAEEGYVVHEPNSNDLLAALRESQIAAVNMAGSRARWSLYSPDNAKAGELRAQGFQISSTRPLPSSYHFLYAPPVARQVQSR